MKLKSFQVRMFRNVLDSGLVPIEDVTALVGKNESGKSALLSALHSLNPAKPDAPLDIDDEYPRWLIKDHQISGEIANAVPITATFELDDDDVAALEASFGKGSVNSREISAYRTYERDGFYIDADVDESGLIATTLGGLAAKLSAAVGGVTEIEQLVVQLDRVISNADPAAPASVSLAGEATEVRAKVTKALANKTSRDDAVQALLEPRVPRTFYFNSYSSLRGRYKLDEVLAALKNGSDDEPVQAAADFLHLARVDAEMMKDSDFEKSNRELEATSSLLTNRVKKHWKQNKHLKLTTAIETNQVTGANGHPAVENHLQFRVHDTRHDFSNRLDRRSTGFQWFVSFLASFLEFQEDTNLILLLDEPGLSLHARAQMDLLNTIDKKLAKGRQVNYSTHSPFLIRTNQLNHVRIVEEKGPKKGSRVIADAGVVSDPDTLFPLQAALGYDIVQSLFIGNRNIIVEGISDFIYLTAISDHLETQGRIHLDPDARLLPAGGATNIPTFIALLGGQLDIVVLIDGSTSPQKIQEAITNGRLDAARVISLSKFASAPKPDIEDLFTPSEYVAIYNDAFKSSIKLSDLTGKDRIVERIGRHVGSKFNHGVVGAAFLRSLDKSIKALSPETIDRFEAVIDALNKALPPVIPEK